MMVIVLVDDDRPGTRGAKIAVTAQKHTTLAKLSNNATMETSNYKIQYIV